MERERMADVAADPMAMVLGELDRGRASMTAADSGGGVTKEQADALGVLIRSGVDPVDAAQRVGLGGVKFTGAVPVSLRLPESEAATVEDR